MIARVYDGQTGEWSTQHVPEVVHDDVARTVTTTSPDGEVTTRDYTDVENRWADQQAADAAALTDLAERVARVEAHLWPPDDPGTTPTARTWAEHGGVWPHGTLLDDGGTIWRNIAKVPLTEPPSRFPGGGSAFGHLFERVTTDTETPDYPAWDRDATYTTGDRVSHQGHAWECLLGHGPERQGTWAPGVAPTIWTDLGPIT